MQQVDIKRLLEEDKVTEGMEVPYRFGYGFDVNYSIKDGLWEEDDTIRTWKLCITSPGAYSLNFIFEELLLSPDAKLYIFNPDGSMVYGPVTAEQNCSKELFLTDLVKGDEVIIHLAEPVKSAEKSTFKISRVVHAYKNLFIQSEQNKMNTEAFPGVGNALSCHNDVNCFSEWQDESHAVAMVLLASGDYLCSGSLLNNTAQNFRPFFLSAFHCVDVNENGVLSDNEITNAGNWAFRFQYKKSCNSSYVTSHVTYNRAFFRAAWQDTDFVLMELFYRPTTNVDSVSYLGWDRSDNISPFATGIHHPKGDVMKISFDEDILFVNNNTINWGSINTISPVNSHWVVDYDNGTTESGSSGSPLFNSNKRVIGQLHGGQSGCAPIIKNYGRFDLSWAGGGTDDSRLSNWLDPGDTGEMTTNTVTIPPLKFSVNSIHNSITPDNSYQFSLLSVRGLMPEYLNFYRWKWYVYETNGWKEQLYAETTGSPQSVSLYFSGNTVYYGDVYIEIKCVGTNSITGQSHTAYANVKCRTCEFDGYAGGKSSSIAYPNPVSNILNIDLDQTVAQANALESVTGAKQLKQDKTFDVRLYDSQGNLLRYKKTKGGKVEFSVSNLPNGVYFLHIYDGTNEKPEIRQIVVEH